jgi:phospholipid transport system substrate-binding protein
MQRIRQSTAFTRSVSRSFLLVCLFLLCAAALRGKPSDTIQELNAALLSTMQTADSLGLEGRYGKLEPVVRHVFDVRFMIRAAIGPTWDTMSADQRQQSIDAFTRYITANYANRFDRYSGQQFRIVGNQMFEERALVRTQIVKATGEIVPINYLLRDDSAGWKICDIYLNGTISELAVRRSEFAAVLSAKGVAGLIALLNEKADKLL